MVEDDSQLTPTTKGIFIWSLLQMSNRNDISIRTQWWPHVSSGQSGTSSPSHQHDAISIWDSMICWNLLTMESKFI